MKIDNLLTAHARAEHIIGRAKNIEGIIEQRMKILGSINRKVWNRDLEMCLSEMEKEIKEIRNLQLSFNLEKEED